MPDIHANMFPLKGMIDIHTEAGTPDFLRQAQSIGLHSVVLKWPGGQDSSAAAAYANHYSSQLFDSSVRFYGGVVLDRAVGGLNPEAVRACARTKGTFTWLPVVDALNHRIRSSIPITGAVQVINDEGKPVPELYEVLDAVAKHDMILGTGHLGPRDLKVIIPLAKQRGVRRIMMNHPLLIGFDIALLRDILEPGVFIEHCYVPDHPKKFNVQLIIDAVDQLGSERSLIGDFGLFGVHSNIGDALIAWGMPYEQVRTLALDTPKRLLEIH